MFITPLFATSAENREKVVSNKRLTLNTQTDRTHKKKIQYEHKHNTRKLCYSKDDRAMRAI